MVSRRRKVCAARSALLWYVVNSSVVTLCVKDSTTQRVSV